MFGGFGVVVFFYAGFNSSTLELDSFFLALYVTGFGFLDPFSVVLADLTNPRATIFFVLAEQGKQDSKIDFESSSELDEVLKSGDDITLGSGGIHGSSKILASELSVLMSGAVNVGNLVQF
eukprot:TRINITY_DN4779_c0_g2_i1.p1 TRINITY_DN4779_c0_g2~~TRINITY_DN4779_c0_g2_i1.p1  ORF type:complete len:121 (+),score=10.04 TRINITY_DN4779_c0_g2_i1:103-465(+)